MTIRELARELSQIKESLQDKDVKVYYPNGEIGLFNIKFVLVDKFNMDKTKENVDFILLY